MLALAFPLFLLAMIVLARVFSRRMTGLGDFFLAGQKLSTLPVAVAFVASWFGAGSTIGTMNAAFSEGVSAAWLIAVPTLLTCVCVAGFLGERVRRCNRLSLPDAVEAQYGPGASLLMAIVLLFSMTAFIASQLVAAIKLLTLTTPFSPLQAVATVLGAVVLYSIIGGFRAVVMTDLFQGAFYTLALMILLVFVGGHAQHQTVHLTPLMLNPFQGWPAHVATTATFLLAWMIAPEMWQRMSATENPGDSRRAAWLAGLMLMGLYAVVIATGVLARGLNLLPLSAHDNVLFRLAQTLPAPLTVVVLLGALVAVASTTDSTLNVASLTLSRNIVHRFFWPRATAGQLLTLSRAGLVIVALPAACIALVTPDIIRILWVSADIYASAMFIPVMGLFFVPRAGTWSACLAMACGLVPVVLNTLHDNAHLPLGPWWPGYPYTTLLGVLFSLAGFYAGLRIAAKPVSPPGSTAVDGRA